MKKLSVAGLIVLLIFILSNTVLGADEESNARFGAGEGIPYGLLGANVEVGPSDYFTLISGIGIAPGGLAWTVGSRIYLADKDQRTRPHFGYYYGTVGSEETYSDYYQVFPDYKNVEGSTIGFGIDWKIHKRISLDGEVTYLLTDNTNAPLIGSRFAVAFGVHF